MIDTDVHRFEDERDVVVFGDGCCFFQPGNDVGVHFFLGHALLVITRDDCHQFAVEFLGDGAAGFDFLDEGVVVFGVVESRPKSPGGELCDCDVQILTQARDGIDVLPFPGPEFVSGESQGGCFLDPLEKRQLPPPHFDIHGELRVGGFSGEFRLGRFESSHTRGAGDYSGRTQKRASIDGGHHSSPFREFFEFTVFHLHATPALKAGQPTARIGRGTPVNDTLLRVVLVSLGAPLALRPHPPVLLFQLAANADAVRDLGLRCITPLA